MMPDETWVNEMLRACLFAALLATSVDAAQQRSCDDLDANASNVDWHEPTRTYANGRIRLIKIDIEEPACCANFLMVLYPAPGQEFYACTLIGREEGLGWGKLELMHAHATYDPSTGLAVTLPVSAYDGMMFRKDELRLTINQAKGSVLAE